MSDENVKAGNSAKCVCGDDYPGMTIRHRGDGPCTVESAEKIGEWSGAYSQGRLAGLEEAAGICEERADYCDKKASTRPNQHSWDLAREEIDVVGRRIRAAAKGEKK